MKILKQNIRTIVGIIIGIIIASNSFVYAYNFATDVVKHTKSDGSETTTELALNELYQMYDADTIILSKIYPVGSYYISENNTNPGTIFGGTWIQITDKVLVAAGSTYSAGSAGGNGTLSYTPQGSNSSMAITMNQVSLSHSGGAVQSHTLTVDEIPSHNHEQRIGGSSFIDSNGTGSTRSGWKPSSTVAGEQKSVLTFSTGGGQGHTHDFTQPNAHTFTPSVKSYTNPTFTGTQATLQTMNSLPRETVYVWKRTA